MLNLDSNARDAIEGEGAISFTISAVELDQHECDRVDLS